MAGSRWTDRETELHERAIADVGGYANFGDPSYLEGLRRLLASYDEEARFHDMGLAFTEQGLLALLKNRLRSEQWWERRPQVLETPIGRPIIITGMVRTGSTALHYLMGANPDMQCLEYWLAAHPQPRPERSQWEASADFQESVAELDMMYSAGEGLEAIHHMTAQGPEECRHLLAQNFTDECFEVNTTVPTYAKWYKETRHIQSYRRHRKLVQLIGSGQSDKRWLLKYPVHLRHIDALLEVYPDACIVWTHRNPVTVLPSYVSLCAAFRSLIEREPDRAVIAAEQMEVWASAVEKGMQVRQGREDQFHDVYFSDFLADPIATVEGIYRRFDVEFTDTARAALASWKEANPPGRFGRHVYDKSHFGIPPTRIRDRFAAYLDHFDLARAVDGEAAG